MYIQASPSKGNPADEPTPPRRYPRFGLRHDHRRPVHRDVARRLWGRRHQDRASARRRTARQRTAQRGRRAQLRLLRPEQTPHRARPLQARRAGDLPRARAAKRRRGRKLPPRRHGAMEPRLGAVARARQTPGDAADDGVRPVRPLFGPRRVRHAGRIDERLRAHQRLSRRFADLAAVRARRRDRRAVVGVRRHAGAVPSRRARRGGPDDRRRDHRADLPPLRSANDDFRPIGDRSGPYRKPDEQQRTAQHLQDARRPLGRDFHERTNDCRPRDGPRRAPRHRRPAVVPGRPGSRQAR